MLPKGLWVKRSAMSKITKTLFLIGCVLVLTSCERHFDNTDLIVGKWRLLTAKGFEIDPDFIWEFNEDESYTITNSQGKFEDDPDDSNPFRAEGVFTGMYHVGAPKGVTIREKYRPPFFFSAVMIDGNKMGMQFMEEDEVLTPGKTSQYIKLTFEKIK